MPKLRLKHYQIPAGGMWHYPEPHSGKTIHTVTYDNLLRILYETYRKNGWPIGLDFENEVEARLCVAHPNECAPDIPASKRRRFHSMKWGDLMRGTRVLLSFKLAGSPVVEPEEAERRADICAACPENVTFDKPCGGICEELLNLVRAAIGSRRTKQHDNLKACSICHCLLEAAVQIPLEHQCKVVTSEMKEQFTSIPQCWKQCL